jgi:hypothetical protein
MSYFPNCVKLFPILFIYSVLRSRSRIRKEPHLLVGAGALTRCGSGSGSDNGITQSYELKNDTK